MSVIVARRYFVQPPSRENILSQMLDDHFFEDTNRFLLGIGCRKIFVKVDHSFDINKNPGSDLPYVPYDRANKPHFSKPLYSGK